MTREPFSRLSGGAVLKRPVSFGLWALALAVPGQAVAQTDQQFDVVCTMQERWREPGEIPDSGTEQTTAHFRVDLAAMRFCAEPCRQIQPVPTDNVEGELNLSYTPSLANGRPYRSVQEFRLNRLTGTATSLYRDSPYVSRGTGACRREPFSGFPEAVF